jgi:hypothetical protein
MTRRSQLWKLVQSPACLLGAKDCELGTWGLTLMSPSRTARMPHLRKRPGQPSNAGDPGSRHAGSLLATPRPMAVEAAEGHPPRFGGHLAHQGPASRLQATPPQGHLAGSGRAFVEFTMKLREQNQNQRKHAGVAVGFGAVVVAEACLRSRLRPPRHGDRPLLFPLVVDFHGRLLKRGLASSRRCLLDCRCLAAAVAIFVAAAVAAASAAAAAVLLLLGLLLSLWPCLRSLSPFCRGVLSPFCRGLVLFVVASPLLSLPVARCRRRCNRLRCRRCCCLCPRPLPRLPRLLLRSSCRRCCRRRGRRCRRRCWLAALI